MLHLRNTKDDTDARLGSEVMVGRSSDCWLRIEDPQVSSRHALIKWMRTSWLLRDLGSSNGTWVDGRKLDPGMDVLLEPGQTLGFGRPEQTWVVDEVTEPAAAARRQRDGLVEIAEDEVLALPSAEHAQVQVSRDDDGRWMARSKGGADEVYDGSSLVVDNEIWTLSLPAPVSMTMSARGRPVKVEEAVLRFEVREGGDVVKITVRSPHREEHLPRRAYNYMLLTLAEYRKKEADEGVLDEEDQGWVDVESLCTWLGKNPNGSDVSEAQINVYVHRIRELFRKYGVEDSEAVIERRSESRKLRLGFSRFEFA